MPFFVRFAQMKKIRERLMRDNLLLGLPHLVRIDPGQFARHRRMFYRACNDFIKYWLSMVFFVHGFN